MVQAAYQITGAMLEEYLEYDRYNPGSWAAIDSDWLRFSMGTGDAIAVSGAAVVLAERYGKIQFPAGLNETNVRSFFVNHPEVEVVRLVDMPRVFNDLGLTTPGVGLVIAQESGSFLPRDSAVDYYHFIYDHFGIDYECRWSKCPIAEAAKKVEQLPVPEGEYVFLHHDPARHIKIDRERIPSDHRGLPIVSPTFAPDRSILAYAEIVRNATYGHVGDSSFFWLAEHIGGLRGKWHLHRYGRIFLDVWQDYPRKQEWTILE